MNRVAGKRQSERSGTGEVWHEIDLSYTSVRELNDYLHNRAVAEGVGCVRVLNPEGKHSLAAGLDAPLSVEVAGDAGYFVAGMNKAAEVTVAGNAGWSVAENIMSGAVRVQGFASECVGASGRGGLVVVERDASSRCGISLKGAELVVGGSVGHFSAFMAQAGRMVVCGDAGHNLGDSLYEAVIYVRGEVRSLGADARFEQMADEDYRTVSRLLAEARLAHDPEEFKRVGSARELYHWNAANEGREGGA